MKTFRCITILGSLLIICLQVIYIDGRYRLYWEECILKVNELVYVSVEKEQFLRGVTSGGQTPVGLRYLEYMPGEEFSSEELDSLKKAGVAVVDLEVARNNGFGRNTGEVLQQLLQDMYQEKGFPVDLARMDSIFGKSVAEMGGGFLNRWEFRLYNKEKELVAEQGGRGDLNYVKSWPIGTKGMQTLQVGVDISFRQFLIDDLQGLIASFLIMLVVLCCLVVQFWEIRKKTALLHKREESVNGVIHDLKSPLNSVVTLLGWLGGKETDAGRKRMMELGRAEVKHLVCNIEALLVVARKDRKQLVLNKTEIDVAELAEHVKLGLDALYGGKRHSIEIANRLPGNVAIVADGMYIENVIRNLVENALKYSDEGVEVRVELSASEKELEVAVKDNGWGIEPRYQKGLFRQFYQVPQPEERTRRGYGIGLTQSRYIVEAHKGKIWFKSVPGQGSTFAFSIPVA